MWFYKSWHDRLFAYKNVAPQKCCHYPDKHKGKVIGIFATSFTVAGITGPAPFVVSFCDHASI